MQAVAAAYSLGAAGLAFGLPTGAELKAGAASVQQTSATSLSVTQTSNRAILNWQSFGIAANESVNFVQPGASAVILNRVVGNDPSAIFGRLTANGHVFLTNPNGVLFARGASVDVGGLVASTLAITNDNFMAGRYLFENPGASGRVENFGQLVARDGGSIALIGPQVANGGTISARLGTAVLAAGDRVTLDFAGDGLLQVRVDQAALKAQVANSGLVAADGGRVVMTSGAANALLDTVVNNSGIVRAASVVERNGEIVLTGAQVVNDGGLLADAGRIEASGDLIVNTGTLNASGASGGTIDVSGRFVALGGHVAADGRGDGGSVSVSATGILSLADRVTATGEAGRGGAITYRSAGSIIETSTGVTDASGAGAGGRIAVDAGGGILSSGTYRAASSAGDGGRIDFTGHGVRLLSATFDASGETRGGLVRLGGAFQGGKTNPDAQGYDLFVTRWGELPALSSAQRLFVNDSSAVDVSSRAGRGGTAVFWSDRETTQLGRINASGAAGGGAVEISSGDVLRHAGLAGLRGAATLLLDPKNIIIGDAETVSTWSYSAILGRGYEPEGSLDLGTALESEDRFGFSVALNAAGNRLAVGANEDNGFGNVGWQIGSVRLFSFTDNNFSSGALQGTIGYGYTGGKNINLLVSPFRSLRFGQSVAFNAAGDRLAVGAFLDDGFVNDTTQSGSVRLFSFTDTNFSGGALQATIGRGYTGGKDLDPGAALDVNTWFGSSVALNAVGDRLAVGAPAEAGFGNVADWSGSVRLFSFTDTNFSGGALQATIGRGYTGGKNLDLGTALQANDRFGSSVALNAAGDRLAVGAPGDAGFGNVEETSGSVRLFSFTDANFSGGVLQGTIGRGYTGGKNLSLGTALRAGAEFGSSVALNAAGDRLAVGAPYDAGFSNAVFGSGAVRLFSFTDTNFSGGALQATIGRGYTGGKDL
ncbi:MAG: filamentous hemagglutinin N-terminal domain-containing protein, partial [Proteobacteria bacterium]|nr:filamentous hemagglutinin N-terminal domain-containing protein [Pseudomonadota bacterium]